MNGRTLLLMVMSVIIGIVWTFVPVYADVVLTDYEILQQVTHARNLDINEYQVIYRAELMLPLSGITGERVKVINQDATETIVTAVTSDGKVVDYQDLKNQERKLHQAKYGRLDPLLYDELQQLDSADELQVVVWLVSETREFIPPIDASPDSKEQLSHKEIQDIKAIAVEEGERYITELQAQFRRNVLDSRALTIGYTSDRAPFVFVTTTKEEVLELSKVEAIDTIYRTTPAEAKSDNLDTQVLSHKSDIVWDFTTGDPGTGVGFAHTEDSQPDWTNPYLTETSSHDPGDTNIDHHASHCAGIAGSSASTHLGHSYGCALYGANGTTYNDDDMADAMDWSVIADVCNNSWGPQIPPSTLDFHDRHCDYLVRHYHDTFTTVSGNHSSYVSWMSYNDITVGGVDANDTADWSDDTMSTFTGYIDPPGTDRELPNVCGDANNIEATLEGGPPWLGSFSTAAGTSYSTPAVGGQCVSMMQRHSTLLAWPEAVKAIVMATALHNVEGNSDLSEYDGAGMVDALAADKMANGLTNGGRQWAGVTLNSGSFPYDRSFGVEEGETVRVVICWNSNPSGPPDYTTDPLDADLDLYLYDSSGTLVASSTRNDSSYELIEITATESASWTMRIQAPTFSGSSERVGFCYWTGNLRTEDDELIYRIYPPESNDNFVFPADPYWQAFAVKPTDTSTNVDVGLYDSSRWGNPADIDQKSFSDYSGSAVDFVLVDGNHLADPYYWSTVAPGSGSGNYYGEFAGSAADITEGTYGPFYMSSSDIIRVWDLQLIENETKYVSVIPDYGDADLRLYVFDSDSADPDTLHQQRSDFLFWTDDGGPGEPEFLEPVLDSSDWAGLVVFSDNRDYSSSSFHVYVDTSGPDNGTISINGGATYTNSRNVTLTLSSSDDQTGVYQMKLGNYGDPWGPYQAYETTLSWELLDVQGQTSVWAWFKNHANIEANGQTGDYIILDTVYPTTICDSPATVVGGTIPVSWTSSDATSGLDYTQLYYAYGTGSWTAFGGQLTGASGTVNFAPPHGPGTYWFGASAMDNAGNLNAVNEFGDTMTDYMIPTATPTNTPTATPTNTPTATATNTPTPAPPTHTPTPNPPTSTPTPFCLNHGDVNFSGDLTAGDAQTTFFIVLGTITPTFEEECAADCNGDGSVTAGDAQNIFLAVLGTATCADPIPVELMELAEMF